METQQSTTAKEKVPSVSLRREDNAIQRSGWWLSVHKKHQVVAGQTPLESPLTRASQKPKPLVPNSCTLMNPQKAITSVPGVSEWLRKDVPSVTLPEKMGHSESYSNSLANELQNSKEMGWNALLTRNCCFSLSPQIPTKHHFPSCSKWIT